MSRRIAGWVLMAAGLAGCQVMWISQYDETTDRGVTELQRSIERHLGQLESLARELPGLEALVEACNPAKFAGTYQKLQTDLRALILRNEAREENKQTVDQLKLLQANVAVLQKQQHDRYEPTDPERKIEKPGDRCLNDGQIEVSRRTLEQNILAILKLELGKRDFRKEE